MEMLIVVLLVSLIVLMVVIIVMMSTGKSNNNAGEQLKEQFLNFQTNIHRDLASTREELIRSKDIMSENAYKTLKTIQEMGETVHRLTRQQEEAEKLGHSLRDLLQTPKLRGNYGETILEELLERVLPRGMWEKQHTIASGRVDAAILVKDMIIPVDSKFPRDDFLRYSGAQTEGDREKSWKDHEQAVRKHIKDISQKYIKPEEGTTDYALMFIPSEAIYYETIAEKNFMGADSTIYDFSLEHHVVPVSPNTFYAFLQVIILSVRNLEVVEHARTLQKYLKDMENSFSLFYRKFEDMGRQVNKAAEAYRVGENHITRYRETLGKTLSLELLSEEDSTPEITSD